VVTQAAAGAGLSQALDEFGLAIRDFIQRADRSGLKASLFDVPGRTALAAEAYRQAAPAFVAELAEHIAPDELGRRMRRLALRPNPMHIVGLLWLPFFRREERRLAGDPRWHEDDTALAATLGFVVEVLRACRGDECFVPGPGDPAMRILGGSGVDELRGTCRPLEDDRARVRKLAAMLELYSFMMHGEHRDGIFSHGPYDAGDGRVLIVRDFTDLQDDFLGWSGPQTRLRHPAVTLALLVERVDVEVDLWGTLHTTADLWDHVRAAAVLPWVAGATGEPLDAAGIDELTREANAAQVSIFRSVVRWPQEERLSYGVRLFANHLRGLPALAGAPDAIATRFVERLDAVAAAPPQLPTPSPMWAHLAGGDGSPYAPLRT
jgi:hypothetical protein